MEGDLYSRKLDQLTDIVDVVGASWQLNDASDRFLHHCCHPEDGYYGSTMHFASALVEQKTRACLKSLRELKAISMEH